MTRAEEKAIKKYIEIHWGVNPTMVTGGHSITPPPPVLVQVGELESVGYITDKGEGRVVYDHFHDEDNRPKLACDPEGRQLYIVGGKYRVKKAGIVG